MGGNYYGTYYRFYLSWLYAFFHFFYFFYHVLVKLQNKENFSDEYKLMVASIVIFIFILLI